MHYAYTLRLYQGNEKAFGPGIASLLELVDRGGSLREAAASMKMAYSKAWQIIRNAEASLGFALLLSKAGDVVAAERRSHPRAGNSSNVTVVLKLTCVSRQILCSKNILASNWSQPFPAQNPARCRTRNSLHSECTMLLFSCVQGKNCG